MSEPAMIHFRMDRCNMYINPAEFFEFMTLTNMRKFFKCLRPYAWANEESIRELFSYLPKIAEDLYAQWTEASREFQRQYKSPDYLKGKEKQKIQRANQYRWNKVKRAKERYERFKKRSPKLEDIKDNFMKEA